MATLLVVEDEIDLQAVLEFNLQQAGHEVIVAGNGNEALQCVRSNDIDLILLDLMLPDISGSEVCRQLKGDPKTREVPIIMLTARTDEVDRVVGFELGVDDYVAKPYSVRELLLRIQAILRRSTRESATPPSRDEIIFGVLRLDSAAHRAWVEDEEIELSALEFKLVTTLLERKNRVQSRSTLLDVVWGMRADVTTRTVDTHVKRLREKLGRARAYIETVRGVGYRFIDHPDSLPEDSD